jgi:pimeloyl-ACP methyl ester carboxylesterase
MPKVKTNGIEVYYEISGSGAPLLLISGLGYGLWQWHKLVPFLVEKFQVITFDNRGAGQTDKPAGPYSADMLAADTAGLLDALAVGPTVVVGHSMGGYVAQALALSRPDLIKTLVLASTNYGGPHHIPITPEALAVIMDRSLDPAEYMRRGVAVACAPGFAEAHPEVVAEMTAYRASVPVPPEAHQAQLAVGLGLVSEAACFEHRLKTMTIPTIIFTGAQDKVVPPGNADLLAQVIPNSRIVILDNAGHHFALEAPDRAAVALLAALRA